MVVSLYFFKKADFASTSSFWSLLSLEITVSSWDTSFLLPMDLPGMVVSAHGTFWTIISLFSVLIMTAFTLLRTFVFNHWKWNTFLQMLTYGQSMMKSISLKSTKFNFSNVLCPFISTFGGGVGSYHLSRNNLDIVDDILIHHACCICNWMLLLFDNLVHTCKIITRTWFCDHSSTTFGTTDMEILGSKSCAIVGCNFNVKPFCLVMFTEPESFVWLLDDAVQRDAK